MANKDCIENIHGLSIETDKHNTENTKQSSVGKYLT